MIKRVYEVKTLEDAKTEAIKDIRLKEDFIQFEVIKEKKGILGIGSSITVEATVTVDPAEQGLKFLEQMFVDMDIEANIEMRKSAELGTVKFLIHTDENPLLIGRKGKTLEAIQSLTRQIINQFSDEKIAVTVDVGGYKDYRVRQLEILATKTAKEVAFSKIPVTLDPMNSYERRVVHTKLSEWRDVYTESIGEGRDRRLVIKPRKK